MKRIYALIILTLFFILISSDNNLKSPLDDSSIKITDRYGKEIRHALSRHGERQYYIELTEIPDQLRNAFILSEDHRFYEHSGVDLKALLRGLYQSIKQRRLVSGGSTITMQVVKLNWPVLKSAWKKPLQIIQSLRIENRYSKGKILDHYLNVVPFGNKIIGLGAACRYFFSKTCTQLSLSEMATLSILPRNPSHYFKKHSELLKRRNDLLKKLILNDPQTLTQMIQSPIEFQKNKPDFHAPHLSDLILSQRHSQLTNIQTTLDLDLQIKLENLLFSETKYRKGSGDTGAILVIENNTGDVLAYVGSPDYFDPVHGMYDGVQALRSPGSALKPFVYELALENGYDLFSIVPDVPMFFSTKRAIYEPHNYGGNFSGPRTIREALGNSKNIPALYMTDKLGEARVLEHLRSFGFSSLNRTAETYGVGLALGNGEVSLWQLAQAYATLARLGLLIPSQFIKSTNIKQTQQVAQAEASYLIADVLTDAEARKEEFGRFGPLEFEFPVAVKTGTSSDYRDHWTIGFTKKFTVAVWKGNADSTPMQVRISASRGTGPLFHQIMEELHHQRSPEWLTQPSSLHKSKVCVLSGKKPHQLCKATRDELHLDNHEPKISCDYHKKVIVEKCKGSSREIQFVDLPPEYSEWSKGSELPTLENQSKLLCDEKIALNNLSRSQNATLEIIEPMDQSTFAIDPSIPSDHQELRFVFRNLAPGIHTQIMLNDKKLSTSVVGEEYFWQLKKGEHRFKIIQNSKVSNEVKIRVL